MTQLGATNESVLQDHAGLVEEVVLARLKVLATTQPPEPTGEELEDHPAIKNISMGAADPVRVFVKNEPHKLAKVRVGRLRLISSVSLPDQLIDRLLMEAQNKALIERWATIPNKPGMGSSDPQLRMLWDAMVRIAARGGLLDSDVSGYDWAVKLWMQICDFTVRCMQMGVLPSSFLGRLMLRAILRQVWPCFVTSDGQMFVTSEPGLQLSGKLNTSTGNSTMRNVLCVCCGHDSMAMGDDCIENGERPEETAELLRSLGFTVEINWTPSPEGAQFCSMLHKQRGVAVPTRWARTFFRLLSKTEITFADLFQFAEEIRHVDEKEKVLEYIKSLPSFKMPQVGGHEEGHEGGLHAPQEGPRC